MFRSGFAHCPQRVFLDSTRGETLSYGDLERQTARVASFLTGLGLKPGERVAAQIDKSPQALALWLGVLRAGLCYLPLNTAYQRSELDYFLGDAEPAVAVCRPQSAEMFGELARSRAVAHLYTMDDAGGGSFAEAIGAASAAFDDCPRREDDLAAIIYTSGTTGRSKGAMVTHGNLTSNAAVLRQAWRIEERDVLIHALPVFHVHGLFVALHPLLLAGARIRLHRTFDAAGLAAELPGATLLMGVPTFYTRLLAEPRFDRAACANMRLFISGSAPLLADTFEAFRERTGHAILERYGMSEAGMITSNPYQGERRAGTVGQPLAGVSVRVANPDGTTPANNEPGEIQIRGPNLFAGYWRMPEKTREEFTADGWFRTGDIGRWDDAGYLSIVGRAKDLIISGGYNVYPKEIELAIDALPGVVESAVVGVPHPDFGEAVAAVVVRAAGGEGAALDEAALIARLRAQIAAFKLPRRVLFVEELPRNAMGKVQKNLLRERLTG